MHLTPSDINWLNTLDRFSSDDAYVIAQRILKNSKEAAEKMAEIKARIDKEAENLKQI